MFNFLKKGKKKDPICGMEDNGKFISKYGEGFCSENCVKEYEKKNQIADSENSKGGGGCCH